LNRFNLNNSGKNNKETFYELSYSRYWNAYFTRGLPIVY
jgi:hypothetical protein